MLKTKINIKEIGAGEGNRTPVVSLEGFCSTIELHPHLPNIEIKKPLRGDLSGGGGWIRTIVDESRRIYSPLHLTALPPLRKILTRNEDCYP